MKTRYTMFCILLLALSALGVVSKMPAQAAPPNEPTPTPVPSPHNKDPDHTHRPILIQRPASSLPFALWRALEELQAVGHITAITMLSESEHVSVMGDEEAWQTLQGWREVIPLRRADEVVNGFAPFEQVMSAQPSTARLVSHGGFITGVITADDGGAPLAGVSVCAWGPQFFFSNCGSTDGTGAYSIYVIPGIYRVRFSPTDYHLPEYYNNVPVTNPNGYTPVTVVTTTVTSNINASLAPGGIMTGRVTDISTNAGLSDVSVQISRVDGAGSSSTVTTDADGYYTSTGLLTGVYHAFFNPPKPYLGEYYDNQFYESDFKPVTVTIASTTAHINAALRAGLLISGTVTGSTALNLVYVCAYRGSEAYARACSYTDANGAYRIGPLKPDTYRVYFSSNDAHRSEWYNDATHYLSATVIALTNTHAPNINATLSLGALVTGTVMDANGTPLWGVGVSIFPVGSSSAAAYGYSNSSGGYVTMPGLASGVYQVRFSRTGYQTQWYDTQPSQATATIITVTAGINVTNINAQLSSLSSTTRASAATGAITGTLTAADTGLPLAASIVAYRAADGSVYFAYTNNGQYVLSNLSPGSYRLLFYLPAPYPYQLYYNLKFDWNSADLVAVTAGMTTTHINQVVPRGGVITGIITSSSGGVPGVGVSAQGASYHTTYTGIDGAYRLEGLMPGNYRVQFTPPSPFIPEWYDHADQRINASNVPVNLNSTTPNINLELSVGAVMTGYVAAADSGLPMYGAAVALERAFRGTVTGAYADMDGYYTTRGLRADLYRVQFVPNDWTLYLREYYSDTLSASAALGVMVPASGVVPQINATLARGGSISGVARHQLTYQTMSDIHIDVSDVTTGQYILYAHTNGYGFYQSTGLPSGSYRLRCSDHYNRNLCKFHNGVDFTATLTVTITAPNDIPNTNIYVMPHQIIYLPLITR